MIRFHNSFHQFVSIVFIHHNHAEVSCCCFHTFYAFLVNIKLILSEETNFRTGLLIGCKMLWCGSGIWFVNWSENVMM